MIFFHCGGSDASILEKAKAMNKVYSFEKLLAFQQARELSVNIYSLTNSFPKFEQYGLADQLRRAVVSVSSNIAEGSGKFSPKEKAYYTSISYSSLLEVLC